MNTVVLLDLSKAFDRDLSKALTGSRNEREGMADVATIRTRPGILSAVSRAGRREKQF